MQCIQSMLSENCLKMAVKPWDGPPRSPGGPRDATLSPAYLGTSPQLEPTTALFIHNFTHLQNWGLCCHLTLPSLRGPLPLTFSRVPPLPPPLVTPAHMGSDISGSGHQSWHWNLTAGHHMPVSPLPP